MKKTSLSVVLATRNEEEHISRCLKSILGIADEIVVADESSIDKTVEIAKELGANVYIVPHQENFHITKNIAINKASKDWILQLDADEVVSASLAREILTVINNKQNQFSGYWINRRNWFLNRFLTKGGQYPDPTLRLYKRGMGILPAKDVHEQATVKGTTSYLTSDLLHYRDTSLSRYLNGFNRYSSIMASQLIGSKINLLISVPNYLFIMPLLTFVKIYIRHKGFVDGMPGFIFALFSALIYPVTIIKVLSRKIHK